MPTLHWIGKEKVINHHQDVPYRILDKQYTFNNEEGVSENKVIHGDNLEALKSLLPEYEGKVKCIYIDPPYNTGNEGWVYNDNVNDPRIKKWLNEVVGKEGEDLTRHDKWLCMMYPRLKILHKLLHEEGVIFISIDDNEQANLKLVCDEIFGFANSIGPIIQNKQNAKNDTLNIQKNHEFILVYRKKTIKNTGSKTIPTLVNNKANLKEVFLEDSEYYYLNDSITTRGEGGTLNKRANLGYTVYYNPLTKDKIAVDDYDVELAKVSNDLDAIYETDSALVSKGYLPIRPPKVRGKLGCWTWSKDKFNNEKKYILITGSIKSFSVKKRTFVNKDDVKSNDGKFYYSQEEDKNSRSILDFSTNDGTLELNTIMGLPDLFDNPKNVEMIEYLISLVPDKNSIILDSFAGSGTTGQAVLNLNKLDNGMRKFILIEMQNYSETLTAERVKRIISGYGEGGKAIKGIGGDFNYYTLGATVFLEDGFLNENIGVEKINEYVWFAETRTKYDPQIEPYLLGKKEGTAYYFYYNKDSETTLNESFLRKIKTKAEQYIIYADNCLLENPLMQKYHIVFKKIPRDITRF